MILWVIVRTTNNVGWSNALFPIYDSNCDKIDGIVNDLDRHGTLTAESVCIFKRK